MRMLDGTIRDLVFFARDTLEVNLQLLSTNKRANLVQNIRQMRLLTCPNPREYVYYILTIALSKDIIILLMEPMMPHDLKDP